MQRDPANPAQALPGSEKILLEIPQPYGNHNGGDLRFGHDGYLYISVGDGGAAGDPLRSGQDVTTLLGAILRIDVDKADPLCETPYSIPPDNPFAQDRCSGGGQDMGLPEIWAWGLRNVWRMSFDRSTGALWAADVGQDVWEEVNVIEGGQNYGWRAVEANECYETNCDTSLYTSPVHAYNHDDGDKSITGGFVYRGSQFPQLWGQYIFGDFESGRVWAIDSTKQNAEKTLLVDSTDSLASFGENADGEIFAVSFERGVLSFVAQNQANSGPPIPDRLSATGCFENTENHVPAASVIPYQVRVPFWSDGLIKHRFFALPANQKMIFRPDTPFEMPVGTVILKTISQVRANGEEHRVETRIIRRDEKGWNGYTYLWRDDQSDADLVAGRKEVVLTGGAQPQTWEVPSRSDCDQCHIARIGYTLGLSTRQLNRPIVIDSNEYAQLDAFAAGGFIDLPAPSEMLATMPALRMNQPHRHACPSHVGYKLRDVSPARWTRRCGNRFTLHNSSQ